MTFFRSCDGYAKCSEKEDIEIISPDLYTQLLPSDGNTNTSEHYKFQSNFTTNIEKSGEYGCKVCDKSDPNKTKCDTNFIKVFANEFSPHGFDILNSNIVKLQIQN